MKTHFSGPMRRPRGEWPRFVPGRQPVLAFLVSAHARSGPAFRRVEPADHRVSGDLRAVCEVEQEAAVAVAVRDVAANRQPVRVHDREPDRIADRDIVRDLALVSVHVMDGEAQVAKAVAAEHVLPAGDREDAVAPNRKSLSSTFAPGAFHTETPLPASLIRPRAGPMISLLPDNRAPGTVDVDAVEVTLDPVPFDNGAAAVFSMKTPESISRGPCRSRESQAANDGPGAETVTTLPFPGPTSTAPDSPSSVNRARDPTGPRCSPAVRTTTSPSAARSITSCRRPRPAPRRYVRRGGQSKAGGDKRRQPGRKMVR